MAKSIFITVPNDLLDQIFADVDREDLINLIKTHRSFMKSAQRHLFHTINLPALSTLAKSFVTYDNKIIDTSQVKEYIRWDQDHNRYLDAGPSILLPIPDAQMPPDYKQEKACKRVMDRQRTCALILQAITLTPHLADYIRHVQIDSEWGSPLFVNSQTYTVLNKLSNLRRVEIVIQDWVAGREWIPIQQVCVQQLFDMLKDLRIQTIVLKTPSVRILSKLMQIPTIRSFAIDTVIESLDDYHPSSFEPTILPNLISFDSRNFTIGPAKMVKLLSQAKNLQSLLITTNSDYVRPMNFEVANGTLIVSTPGILKASLGPNSSLKELALLEPAGVYFTEGRHFRDHLHPTINANFSFLKHLRILKITSAFWYNRHFDLPSAPENGWMWKKQDRCAARVYNFLPPSLRELEIQFMWPEVVFAAGLGYQTHFPLTPQATQLKGFEWIKEFAEQKQRKKGVLPELECLRLVEIKGAPSLIIKAGGPKTYATDTYSPPEVMRELFENAGIKLVIKLSNSLQSEW
ncbi:unnamed protein product [Alternaria alternata]